jgi:sugar transferase EpsL
MTRSLYPIVKRVMDLTVAFTAMLLLSPMALIIAIAIRIRLGSPVLFRQERIGRHDRPFSLWKFRTMHQRTDRRGVPLPDAERLCGLGCLLRAASLDELPQLWNVVRGEMSMIGPRPLLPQYLPRYSLEQRRRHDVLPGITGWAQVNGRNDVTWERKFQLDLWYVQHCGLAVDLRILWMTLSRVVEQEGVSNRDHATMPEFMGTAGEARRI